VGFPVGASSAVGQNRGRGALLADAQASPANEASGGALSTSATSADRARAHLRRLKRFTLVVDFYRKPSPLCDGAVLTVSPFPPPRSGPPGRMWEMQASPFE